MTLAAWQTSLDSTFLARLLRPLVAPGIISADLAEQIFGRSHQLHQRLSLLHQCHQRWSNQASLQPLDIPIVYAQWATTDETVGQSSILKDSSIPSEPETNFLPQPRDERQPSALPIIQAQPVNPAAIASDRELLTIVNQTTTSQNASNDRANKPPHIQASRKQNPNEQQPLSMIAQEALSIANPPAKSSLSAISSAASLPAPPLPIVVINRVDLSEVSRSDATTAKLPVVQLTSLRSPTTLPATLTPLGLSPPAIPAEAMTQPATLPIVPAQQPDPAGRNRTNPNADVGVDAPAIAPAHAQTPPSALLLQPLPLAHPTPSTSQAATASSAPSSAPTQSSFNRTETPPVVSPKAIKAANGKPPAPPVPSAAGLGRLDVEAIATQVERKLARRLLIERERRGQ